MQLKFKDGNNKKYKFEKIWDSAVYIKKLNNYQLLILYFVLVIKAGIIHIKLQITVLEIFNIIK